MYIYLICPIISWCIAQGTKVFIRSLNHKITLQDFFAYSNMPSSHTAIIVGLLTIVGLENGLNSPLFALNFVFALIVVTDAIGLRNYLGAHGKTLNILVKDLKEDEFLDRNYPKQLEHIGHTPMQILVGAIIGIVTSLIIWYLL